MFSGTIQDFEVFQALLSGETVVVCENDEPSGISNSVFVSGDSWGIPEDGLHWMFLNGEKFLVCVEGENSDPEDCPCCAWGWVSFRILC